MNDLIRVLLADDHPVLLKGLFELVGTDPDFDVVGTASSGAIALARIRDLRPDIAVLDLSMPEVSGLGILADVQRNALPVRVVFLTAMITDEQVVEAMAAGIWGILLKESAPETLLDDLRSVASGKRRVPPEMVQRALSRQAEHHRRECFLRDSLTLREREIVSLACEGRSNNEIAAALGLSSGTVRIHLHNIYTKLNVPNRTALTALVLSDRAH